MDLAAASATTTTPPLKVVIQQSQLSSKISANKPKLFVGGEPCCRIHAKYSWIVIAEGLRHYYIWIWQTARQEELSPSIDRRAGVRQVTRSV